MEIESLEFESLNVDDPFIGSNLDKKEGQNKPDILKILKTPNLGALELKFLVLLNYLSEDNQFVRVSNTQFCILLNCGRELYRAKANLIKKKMIEVESTGHGRGKVNSYRINLEERNVALTNYNSLITESG